MPISPTDFQFVSGLVRREAGIVLEPGKEYLVESRLANVVRNEKLASIADVITRLKGGATDPIRRKVIEAMTTNETSFFRDQHPFVALKTQVLPGLFATRAAEKSLSIWCAASSTGQEPYTIAMTLRESCPRLDDWKLTFLATDISTEMIDRSRQGKYNQIEVNRGLPAALLVKYFDKDGAVWQIRPELRSMIDFRQMNLTTAWPTLPMFDLIFMRNVLIYFDADAKRDIFRRMRRVLHPGGYLFLGGAETTMSIDDSYERVQIDKSGCYRLKSTAKAEAA